MLTKLYRKGWEVRMLSVTDGSAGTYRTELAGEPLAEIRRKEAAASGKLLEADYDLMDCPDGRLEASVENREKLIRYIRRFSPDLIITNRLNDYHADHRNTAQLVQDAAYLLTVPTICKDTPYMESMPVVLYWHDSFKKPYPFSADVIVSIDDTWENILQHACCHESQYFDWMYWPDHMERVSWTREEQIGHLRARYDAMFRKNRENYDCEVRRTFGELADSVRRIEAYEISEYGTEPTRDFLDILEK